MTDPRLGVDEGVGVLERIHETVADPELRRELLRVVILGARGELAPPHVSPLLQHRALWLRHLAFHVLLPRVRMAAPGLRLDPDEDEPDP
jgi:hypothetical protein